ncbi:MAG: DEAD/DEAH box helicase family protein [Firmicutes bacterium]|jgi:competence protein ComFA|nr:DEAD/DEAH box helicase family protein [Bacillota bacterium]
MYKLQIISTFSPDGHRFWAARAPERMGSWLTGQGRHTVLGPPLPGDEAFLRLSLLEYGRILGRLASFAAHLAQRRALPQLLIDHPIVELSTGLAVLQEVLAGRIVFQDRLVTLLRAEGLWPAETVQLLDYAVYNGFAAQLPGVSRLPWGALRCNRCGGESVVLEPCPTCRRRECPLCTDCLSLGPSRGCRLLVFAPDAGRAQAGAVDFHLTYSLTPAQERAAFQLEEFFAGPRRRTLIWAACGAGKTEVTFPMIRRALQAGQKVLFAVPRQDVVRELAERFRSAFTGVEIAVHYGGRPWQAGGDLVVATTHQVLHFYERFGLAVLDEMDAFPYQGSEMLRFGLMRALRPEGKLVEMSATPNPVPKRGTAVTIPVRHHGYPLPAPEFIKSRPGEIPGEAMELLQDRSSQWIVFVPTVAACNTLTVWLREKLGEEVANCHSKHPHRREQIEAFRTQKRRVMVATAVLERGVTFPGVQVIVVDADHPIYSRSALVQMAGRVGRTAEQPGGRVVFCGARRNAAVRGAQAMIGQLNQEAADLGLLRSDTHA